MIITLNGSAIDTNTIDRITEAGASTVYMIDGDDTVYIDRDSAMESAPAGSDVCEYSVNVAYSESEGYYLIDEGQAPLEYTGEYWTAPTTYRDLMEEEGGNLGWCVPYLSDDGTVALTVSEGHLDAITVDGKEAYLPADREALLLLHDAVLRLVSDPSDYEFYTDLEILTQHGYVHEGECRDCPWFGRCEAMDAEV